MPNIEERFAEFVGRVLVGAKYYAFEAHLFGVMLLDFAERES